MKIKYPKILYAIYDSSKYMEEIVFVTGDKDTANKFLRQRNYNTDYEILEIDKKEHIKKMINYAETHNLYGELIGDIIFTTSEYEWFSDAYMELIQDILFTLDDYLIKNLKYLKLREDELEIIVKFCVMLKNKLDSIYADTPSEEDIKDEDDVFYIEKVAEYFFKESIL